MDLQFVPGQTILDKVNRDAGFKDTGSNYDVAQWIVDALEFIGTLHIYEKKSKIAKINNYLIPLFCGIEKLSEVFYKESCLWWVNYNPCCPTTGHHNSPNLTVALDPPYLRFNFTDTEVNITYLGIPTDAESFPKIPDNPYVKEAVFWYVVFKMLLSGNTHPTITIGMASEEWTRFKVQSQNSLNMPYANTIDETLTAWRSGPAFDIE